MNDIIKSYIKTYLLKESLFYIGGSVFFAGMFLFISLLEFGSSFFSFEDFLFQYFLLLFIILVGIILFLIFPLPRVLKARRLSREQERLLQIPFSDQNAKPIERFHSDILVSDDWLIYPKCCYAFHRNYIQSFEIDQGSDFRGRPYYKVIIRTVDKKKYRVRTSATYKPEKYDHWHNRTL